MDRAARVGGIGALASAALRGWLFRREPGPVRSVAVVAEVGNPGESRGDALRRGRGGEPVVQRDELERLAIGVGELRQRCESAADRMVQPEGGDRGGGGAQDRILGSEFGLQPRTQGRIRRPEGPGRHRRRPALRAPEQGKDLLGEVPVDGQNRRRHLHHAPHRDDAAGDHVPDHQRLRRRALGHADRIAAPHEVAREKALARSHVADLVEAHRRVAQRLDVGAVDGGLLPAAPFEVVAGKVAPVLPGQRAAILEGAVHGGHRGLADHVGQVEEVDVVQIAGLADVLLHQLAHPLPPRVAARPLDQAGGTSPDLAQRASLLRPWRRPPGPRIAACSGKAKAGLACRSAGTHERRRRCDDAILRRFRIDPPGSFRAPFQPGTMHGPERLVSPLGLTPCARRGRKGGTVDRFAPGRVPPFGPHPRTSDLLRVVSSTWAPPMI